MAAAIVAGLWSGAAGVAAEPEQAPLQIQRQQTDGRLDALERKREGNPRQDTVRTQPAPGDPAPVLAGPPRDRMRQDLERRALEDRQRNIGRDLDRLGGQGDAQANSQSTVQGNPSSSGLLGRLRRD